jgi:hypothetical protein
MIGDFDDSANALRSLYGKEAKSQDEARIQALKVDMGGVLIYVRLYSICPIARLGIACFLFPSRTRSSQFWTSALRQLHVLTPGSSKSSGACVRY